MAGTLGAHRRIHLPQSTNLYPFRAFLLRSLPWPGGRVGGTKDSQGRAWRRMGLG